MSKVQIPTSMARMRPGYVLHDEKGNIIRTEQDDPIPWTDIPPGMHYRFMPAGYVGGPRSYSTREMRAEGQ